MNEKHQYFCLFHSQKTKKTKTTLTKNVSWSIWSDRAQGVKDIIYLDYENNKDEELANQIFQKEQKIKRELKKVNVDEKNIINTKRERKTINKLDL